MITRRRGVARRVLLGMVLASLTLSESAAASEKMVALTFDDGPSSYTKQVLNRLENKGASGTFFVLGGLISGREHLLRKMWTARHQIGNHTWSHPRLTRLSTAAIEKELDSTDLAIQQAVAAVGGGQPEVFRPPYGDVDGRVEDIARAKGMQTVLWDVNPRDYNEPGTSTIVRRVVNRVDTHSIVLLHDGGGDRSQTVEAVPKIIRKLRDRGYEFVTVSEFYSLGG